MIVERNFFNIKPGCMDEIIRLSMEYKAWNQERNVKFRIYKPIFAPLNVLCFEFEYESLARYEEVNNELYASPEFVEFLKKWSLLASRGGASEAWELVETG